MRFLMGMIGGIIVCVGVTSAVASFKAPPPASVPEPAKADRTAIDTDIAWRPVKRIYAQIPLRECPQGYRDVMEADGSIGGCWRDRGKR